jgi:hypothetical protein
MMTREAVIKALGGAFVDQGFEGRGRLFRLVWPELTWMLQLESIPRTGRVGIYVGVCPSELVVDAWPSRANDCPIILHPEGGGPPFGLDHWDVWQALDTASELPDDVRIAALAGIARATALVANRTTTISDLRDMSAEGHLRGFVRRDARSLLSGDDEAS